MNGICFLKDYFVLLAISLLLTCCLRFDIVGSYVARYNANFFSGAYMCIFIPIHAHIVVFFRCMLLTRKRFS